VNILLSASDVPVPAQLPAVPPDFVNRVAELNRLRGVLHEHNEAVVIAEAAVKVRHDIFTEDALAWAYFKAGRIDQARRTIRLALRTGARDREILRHAKVIG